MPSLRSFFFAFTSAVTMAFSVTAAENSLSLTVEGIAQGKAIPPQFSYCAPEHKEGTNQRPALSWQHVPAEAKSLALIVVDPDVPTDFTDAGKKGKTISASMKRQDFYHWVVVNIPPHTPRLAAGSGRGADKKVLNAGRSLVNDYAKFHPKQPVAHFLGYDGPCPPWNDERVHHYHFQLHALDVDALTLPAKATAAEAAALIRKHSIQTAEVMGTYTLNAALRD